MEHRLRHWTRPPSNQPPPDDVEKVARRETRKVWSCKDCFRVYSIADSYRLVMGQCVSCSGVVEFKEEEVVLLPVNQARVLNAVMEAVYDTPRMREQVATIAATFPEEWVCGLKQTWKHQVGLYWSKMTQGTTCYLVGGCFEVAVSIQYLSTLALITQQSITFHVMGQTLIQSVPHKERHYDTDASHLTYLYLSSGVEFSQCSWKQAYNTQLKTVTRLKNAINRITCDHSGECILDRALYSKTAALLHRVDHCRAGRPVSDALARWTDFLCNTFLRLHEKHACTSSQALRCCIHLVLTMLNPVLPSLYARATSSLPSMNQNHIRYYLEDEALVDSTQHVSRYLRRFRHDKRLPNKYPIAKVTMELPLHFPLNTFRSAGLQKSIGRCLSINRLEFVLGSSFSIQSYHIDPAVSVELYILRSIVALCRSAFGKYSVSSNEVIFSIECEKESVIAKTIQSAGKRWGICLWDGSKPLHSSYGTLKPVAETFCEHSIRMHLTRPTQRLSELPKDVQLFFAAADVSCLRQCADISINKVMYTLEMNEFLI